MGDLAQITAVVLAGGLGTRLRSVVADRPKVLAEVHGRPFLALLLDHLVEAGIRTVVLCTGYRGEDVRSTFGKSYKSLTLLYSCESEPMGTAGALRKGLDLFKSDPVMVLNGDSISRADLFDFYRWHSSRPSAGTLVVSRKADTGRFGCIRFDQDGRILGFNEKAGTSEPGWVSAGVYLLSRRLLDLIAGEKTVSLEYDVFPIWVGKGLYAYRSGKAFWDIGTPESYAQAEEVIPHPPKIGEPSNGGES